MAGLGNRLARATKSFTQKSGPRKGQSFTVKRGKSGLSVRKYASGDTAIAQTDSGVDIAKQKADVANRFEGSARKVKPGRSAQVSNLNALAKAYQRSLQSKRRSGAPRA